MAKYDSLTAKEVVDVATEVREKIDSGNTEGLTVEDIRILMHHEVGYDTLGQGSPFVLLREADRKGIIPRELRDELSGVLPGAPHQETSARLGHSRPITPEDVEAMKKEYKSPAQVALEQKERIAAKSKAEQVVEGRKAEDLFDRGGRIN